jgi:two-component system chemotaxis sensor kinase CheA
VRINTDKLDYLVDMAGELVIAQSLIRYDPDLHLDRQPRLARNLSQLARITAEVQRTTMAMRMVPVGGLFQKMARLVRDLGRKFGRDVEFEGIGADVELDRNIVEELGDPLMHMIRNAVDHGVEPPGERVAAGKEPAAHVRLRAAHQAGQIVIEVSDDGRGLDRAKILAKARAQGLVAANSEPSDSEVFNLIFHPGFSTAAQLSEVSGRGVGMDVVRRQITKLRGSIEIQSKAGTGTKFSLKLPLTLAIIDGLVVSVGEERYVVPIFAVRELLRPSADTVFTVGNRNEMVLIREQLVPVVRLYEKFRVVPRATEPANAVFVLAEFDGRCFCLMVDTVIGKQEIVIKSLGEMFQKVTGVAGGAILGDGRVALILDPPALFSKGKER